MPFPRPKSMLGLVLIGFSLVTLPLIVSVLRAVVYVDNLTSKSERLVLEGVQMIRESESLAKQITDMERNARQYQVVGDPALLELYEEKHARFIFSLEVLQGLPLKVATINRLAQMRSASEAIASVLQTQPRQSPEVTEALGSFKGLGELANCITEHSERFIDNELENLENKASARRIVVWQSAALIPVTLVLVLLFTFLIARPIRQIRRAIRGLGAGSFATPITVSSPAELRALGDELDWLRRRLLELEDEKNRFLCHMSHELKTPLASIREGAELLADGTAGDLSLTQKEVVNILREGSLQLQHLVESLLNFSAWQEKRARLDLTKVNAGDLLEEILDQHRLAIVGKQLAMRVACEDVTFCVDREKIHIVLDNLVSNAIRFSPPGGAVRIGVARNQSYVIVDIADEGPGIPIEERSYIFDPFYQGKRPQAGPVRGTGIGLSLVREGVHAHQGRIEIVDGVNSGAHFRILLPNRPTAEAP